MCKVLIGDVRQRHAGHVQFLALDQAYEQIERTFKDRQGNRVIDRFSKHNGSVRVVRSAQRVGEWRGASLRIIAQNPDDLRMTAHGFGVCNTAPLMRSVQREWVEQTTPITRRAFIQIGRIVLAQHDQTIIDQGDRATFFIDLAAVVQ
jgi:hypothetical protein